MSESLASKEYNGFGHAREVMAREGETLRQEPRVAAVGLGVDADQGTPLIRIFLDETGSEADLDCFPSSIEGIPVRVNIPGWVKAATGVAR